MKHALLSFLLLIGQGGYFSGSASGQNLIQNGTFNSYPTTSATGNELPPGTDLGGWSSGLGYAGTGMYPPDTKISVQTGAVVYYYNMVRQGSFPGDAAHRVPPANTWLYSNGNVSGLPMTVWIQRVNVKPNTDYLFSFYTSNAISSERDLKSDPVLRVEVDGKPVGKDMQVYDEADPRSGHNGRDGWDRRVVHFQTGPATTNIELKIIDLANDSNGDDLALTALDLHQATKEEIARTTGPTGLALFPNPAVRATRLDLRTLPLGKYEITFVDAVGRWIRSEQHIGGEMQAIDLRDLPVGTYLVRVRGANTNHTLRLLKE
ncbi:T9SS C-terminal target domain-containing protein [Hymenobacter oligotrophus]|uniref:T9SS C-terminal target domain-containing protein n=1 Tax=Hymenobacter oligotrophus TaxID=2319843 RepID=A0A3B7R2Y0_9BACT|nr:T9SS type A sorting domain-containing protein [Hymenobacter oligotrophus]AYA35699.1 T9SS C-terminal target domain-containing protein [Hymenobacter oligotrophus]